MNIIKFSLAKLIITNGNNTQIDFTANFRELKVYEDLFQPFLSGEITIVDDSYILEDLPLIGNEDIYISIKLNSEEGQYSFELKNLSIIRSGYIEINGESIDKSKIYNIFFVEKEGLIALNEFSKSYKEKIISEIVKDISINILEREIKTENIEATKGTYDLAFPFMTPIDMIYYVSRKYALNSKGQYGYLYYTDISQTTHYKSLNTLMNEKEAYTIFEDSRLSENIDNNSIRDKGFDTMLNIDKLIKNGYFGNKHIYFNNETKQIVEEENTISTYNKENNFLGTNSFYDKNLKDYKLLNLSVDEEHEEKNKMLFSSLTNYNIIVKQEGNYEKKIGMVVNFDIPAFIKDETELEDSNFSGKWLCSKQTHTFDANGYIIYSTLVKNAFKEQKYIKQSESV